jgi:hypothetical protein
LACIDPLTCKHRRGIESACRITYAYPPVRPPGAVAPVCRRERPSAGAFGDDTPRRSAHVLRLRTRRRNNHRNIHVRGYKERGNINTPLDLAIRNQVDRFTLAMDVIDRVPALRVAGAHAKEKLRNMQIECQNYAYEHGIDKPEVDQWTWPGFDQAAGAAR